MDIKKNDAGLYDVEIDGKTYSFSKWRTTESLNNLKKLAKIVAEPLGLVVGNVIAGGRDEVKSLLDLNFQPEMVSNAARALMENMDAEGTTDLIKKFSSGSVLCEGAKIDFETHYQEDLLLLCKVVAAGVEVQYGGFFAGIVGQIGTLSPKPKKSLGIANRAQETSTGTSGRR